MIIKSCLYVHMPEICIVYNLYESPVFCVETITAVFRSVLFKQNLKSIKKVKQTGDS